MNGPALLPHDAAQQISWYVRFQRLHRLLHYVHALQIDHHNRFHSPHCLCLEPAAPCEVNAA